MPLSEQEQRLLDEMERSLYHGDGDFVASVGRTRGGVNYTALVGGVLLALGGVGVLLAGVALHAWIVGVLGFVAMFAGVLIAAGNPNRRPLRSAGAYPGSARSRGRFMDRLAERWERRRQG